MRRQFGIERIGPALAAPSARMHCAAKRCTPGLPARSKRGGLHRLEAYRRTALCLAAGCNKKTASEEAVWGIQNQGEGRMRKSKALFALRRLPFFASLHARRAGFASGCAMA